MGGKHRPARSQKCRRLGAEGQSAVQISAGKRERTATAGYRLRCGTSEEGQEVSLSKQSQGKCFQEAEREQYCPDCWLKGCSLDAAATSRGAEVQKGHLQAKSWPNSTVIFTNGSKVASHR